MEKGGKTLKDQDRKNSSQKDEVAPDGPVLDSGGFSFPRTESN
jgi:hypothetical protein